MVLEFTIDVTRRVKPSCSAGQTPRNGIEKRGAVQREDGSFDVIVSIDKKQLYTQTYNLRPVTTDLLSNIVVAQGFLNGSARFQSEFVDELNRVLLRANIPRDVIPVD